MLYLSYVIILKLIKLTCPRCGSKLEANGELKNFTCNYCGNNIFLDDEVIHVEHTIAPKDTEKMFNNAFKLIDNKEYFKANLLLNELEMECPDDARVYEGRIRILTNDLTLTPTEKEIPAIENAINNYSKYSKNKDYSFAEIIYGYANKLAKYKKAKSKLKKTMLIIIAVPMVILFLLIIIGLLLSN